MPSIFVGRPSCDLDDHAGREAILDERRRVVQRHAGCQLRRLVRVRPDLARRSRRARGEPGSRRARAHELEEPAAADPIEALGRRLATLVGRRAHELVDAVQPPPAPASAGALSPAIVVVVGVAVIVITDGTSSNGSAAACRSDARARGELAGRSAVHVMLVIWSRGRRFGAGSR